MTETLESTGIFSKETILRLYREMVNIRKTEEQLAKSYAQGMIPGACHTYIGQEAVAVGDLRQPDPSGCGLLDPPRTRSCPGQGRGAEAR